MYIDYLINSINLQIATFKEQTQDFSLNTALMMFKRFISLFGLINFLMAYKKLHKRRQYNCWYLVLLHP